MRTAEPRYYTSRRQWYVMHKGKRHVLLRLAPGETEQRTKTRAWQAYADLVSRLKAEGVWEVGPGDRISVATMGKRYLDAMRVSLAPRSFPAYRLAVNDLVAACGERAADEIRAEHVEAIYADKGYSVNTVFFRCTLIKGWWRWAAARGLIPQDHLAGLRKPAPTPRSRIPTPEECRTLLDADKPGWIQDVLVAVHQTGCRPSEVFRLTAADVSLADGCWRLHGKTTRRTGRPREVHFTPKVRKILVRRMKQYPTGPLFRRPTGAVHLEHATISPEIGRIREGLGLGDHVTIGSMRHLFATDALERGESPSTVAALLGHSGTDQIAKTYGRLIDRKDHLKEALGRIRGDG